MICTNAPQAAQREAKPARLQKTNETLAGASHIATVHRLGDAAGCRYCARPLSHRRADVLADRLETDSPSWATAGRANAREMQPCRPSSQ